jgi:hypothetical protein
VANQAWRDIFPLAEVNVEEAIWSNHSPIFLHLSGMAVRERRMGSKFRHEASWTLKEEYSEVIKQVWGNFLSGTSHWDHLGVKLKGCRNALTQWQRGKKDPKYKELKTKPLKLQEHEGLSSREEEKNIQKELQILLDRDDARWRQRAKKAWLKSMDRNTTYYHACANAKRRKNFIYAIKDLEGRQRETTEIVGVAFVEYFSELFMNYLQ